MRVVEVRKYELFFEVEDMFALMREIKSLVICNVDMMELRLMVLEPIIRSYLDGENASIVLDEATAASISNWLTKVLDENKDRLSLPVTRAVLYGLRRA